MINLSGITHFLYFIYSSSGPFISELSQGELPENYAAFARYSEIEGWKNFYVETNPNYPNEEQFFAAGYLEGYVYCNSINEHFENIKEALYQGSFDFSIKVNNFISSQKDFYKGLSEKSSNEYEEMIKYIIQQYKGLYQGYFDSYKTKKSHAFPLINENEFYYISYLGDLSDLVQAYPKTQKIGNKLKEKLNKDCTAYIKYLPEENDIIIAHNTHNIYSMMNRVYKHYNIKVTTISTKKTINQIKFTSRPGDLNSKDDYYFTSNKMVILETSLQVYNTELYSNLNPKTVPKFLRSQIANFISQNNEDWTNNFLKYNSGTHNNQWFIVDYKKLNTEEKNGLVYIIEQTPNLTKKYYRDLTNMLLNDGYLGSYNAPFFNEVKIEMGYKEEQDYYHAYRYFVIKSLNNETKTIENAQYLISYHDKEHLSDNIGCRCDIESDFAFGAIDGKVINKNMLNNMKSTIRYGPPYITGVSLPFTFKDKKFENVPRYGICDDFEFNWIEA